MTSPIPVNKTLYNKVKNEAKKKFKHYPSLYASSWIVKEYKKRGGKYKGKKPAGSRSKSPNKSNKTKNLTGINKWYAEQWVQVGKYLEQGSKVDCGASNRETKACRPLKRIDKTTPITIPELLKIHSKSKLISLAKKKQKDMNGRVVWKTGNFFPSK
jgi:hypothetical protein